MSEGGRASLPKVTGLSSKSRSRDASLTVGRETQAGQQDSALPLLHPEKNVLSHVSCHLQGGPQRDNNLNVTFFPRRELGGPNLNSVCKAAGLCFRSSLEGEGKGPGRTQEHLPELSDRGRPGRPAGEAEGRCPGRSGCSRRPPTPPRTPHRPAAPPAHAGGRWGRGSTRKKKTGRRSVSVPSSRRRCAGGLNKDSGLAPAWKTDEPHVAKA